MWEFLIVVFTLNASVTLMLSSTPLPCFWDSGLVGGSTEAKRPFEIHEGICQWYAWGNWFNNKRRTCHSSSGGIVNVVSVCVNNKETVWCYYINVKPSVLLRHLVMTPSHFHLSFNISSTTLADCHWYTGKFNKLFDKYPPVHWGRNQWKLTETDVFVRSNCRVKRDTSSKSQKNISLLFLSGWFDLPRIWDT